MSVDLEREVAAALHSAASEFSPPSLDPKRIRQAGRRRQRRVVTFRTLATAVVIAGAVTGALQFGVPGKPGARAPSLMSSPSGSAPVRGNPAGIASPPPFVPSRPSGPPAAIVRAFFITYEVARIQDRAAADPLLQSYAARWFAPLLEESPLSSTGPAGCGLPGNPARWAYRSAGEISGRSVTLVSQGPLSRADEPFDIVVTDAKTGLITGIACTDTGQNLTPANGRNAAADMYGTYRDERHRLSLRQTLAWMLAEGPYAGRSAGAYADWYLRQAQLALASGSLTYDPIMCTPAGLPQVRIGAVKVVGDGGAVLVVVTPAHAKPILLVVVLSAKDAAPAAIACQNP